MSLNVLFIGNSHTYLNYMPQMLGELVQADDSEMALNIDQITGEGVGLKWHWKNEPSQEKIQNRQWDYVVLQDRSGGPLENLDSFRTHARLLDTEIRRHGAKTVFYMTWASKSRPQTQKLITEAYSRIAIELGAVLAPVGLVWEKAHALDVELNLHHMDNRHANPTGAYLTACVFYTILFNASPQGLPATLRIEGKIRLDLTEDRAEFMQKIAYETVKNLEL